MPPWLVSTGPWYGFRYAIYQLAGKDQTKIKHMQDTWAPIQQRFFAEAEHAAAAAEKLTVDGANAMLGKMLANFSDTIKGTLEMFNATLGP